MKFLQIYPENIKNAKGSVSYLHGGEEIGSGAFFVNESAKLMVKAPRYASITSVRVEFFDQSFSSYLVTDSVNLYDTDNLTDSFLITLDLKKLGRGLFFFRLVLNTAAGELYGYGSRKEMYLSESSHGKYLQLSVFDAEDNDEFKYGEGIIYHIFVDRFAKGGAVPKRADAVIVDGWDEGKIEYPEYPGAPLKNNTFFGGTLYGIINKLDYVKSLGATLIYLSPVFEAASNHKYDTGDYMKVDEMFGSDEALRQLIDKAKEKGIGIILDGVFNHTGADSIYFNRYGRYDAIGAYQSKESPFYPWYDFKDHPDKYTCWWDIEILPRINPDIKECGDFIAGDGGVIEKYAKLGAVGFRLDVADELSDSFIKRIKSKLAEINKNSILYGEVWEDASNKIAYNKRKEYYLGGELDGVMNYPLRRGIIDFLRHKRSENLKYALEEVTFNAPLSVQRMQMNLLGTHDTERIITTLGGDSGEGVANCILAEKRMTVWQRELGAMRLKLAYSIIAALPGIPCVYYGDEIGLEGYSDPFNRRPFPWGKEDSDILDFYKKIGSIRAGNSVLSKGDFELILLTDDCLIFKRSKNGKVFLCVVNNSDVELSVKFDKRVECEISKRRIKEVILKPYTSELIKTTDSNIFVLKNPGEPT